MDLFHQTEIKAVDGKSLSTYFISDILGKRRKCELRSQCRFVSALRHKHCVMQKGSAEMR